MISNLPAEYYDLLETLDALSMEINATFQRETYKKHILKIKQIVRIHYLAKRR